MANFPKRIRNHELSDESKKAFENAIPSSWTFAPSPVVEYGIDGIVEISRSGEMRGEEFKVQLKSTDSDNERESVILEISTYNYYQEISQLCPVLMVLYHVKSKKLYVRWFHEFDPYYDKSGKKAIRPQKPKTLSFYWNKDDLWKDETTQKIEDDIAIFRLIKSHQVRPPFKFFVKYAVDSIQDKPISLIFLRLNNKISSLNIFNFEYQDEQNSIGTIEITDKHISCGFKMNTKIVFHLNNTPQTSKVAIEDLFIALLIVALKQINFNDHVASLSKFIVDSEIVFLSERITGMVINSFVEARNWDNYVKILSKLNNYADSLDDNEKTLMKFKILASIMANREYVGNNAVAKILIDNIKSSGFDLATSHYNLGNHYRGNGKMKEAFHNYRLAAKSNPQYKERDYFWRELGGIFFEMRRYRWSAMLYAKAIRINNNPETLCLYADALMYRGKYLYAKKRFEEYLAIPLKEGERHRGEWHLKYMALNFMLELTGIERQNRNNKTVNKLIENARAISKEWTENEVIELFKWDMLSGDAWYVFSYISQKKEEDTYVYALFCSALLDCVVPDLLNISMYMMNNINDKNIAVSLVYDVLDFILFKRGEMELVETFAEAEIAGKSPEVVNIFYEFLQQVKDTQQKKPCVLRLCGDDGVYSAHKMGSKKE